MIEMMITIAILGLLIMLAMPSVGSWLLNTRIRTAAESLQNGLQLARMEAVRCNVPVQFVLGAGYDSAWSIQFAYPNLPTPCKSSIPVALWPTVQSRPANEGSSGVTLAATPANATTVAFDGMGRRLTANADGSGVLTRICVDLPSSILASGKTRDLELNIESGGGVRMCDPKVTDASDTRVCPDRAGSICTNR